MHTRVIATLASVSAAMMLGSAHGARASTEYFFQSPSGNITCVLADYFGQSSNAIGVECDVRDHTFQTPPRPADCRFNFGDRFSLVQGQPAVMACHGDSTNMPGEEALAYGDSRSIAPISCDSEPSGMKCTDASSGHYFRAASDSFELH
jgi:hypothetical protein